MMAGITLALFVRSFAGGIDRMDLFDAADNRLLFVTFEYDSTGNNIGRTVYASDSTFLRSLRLTKDAGGNVTAENSTDYESNPLFTTRISPQSGRTDFTVSDQFNMDMLGAPMSYTKSAAGEYAISQGGATLYKQKYAYAADGSLTRIDYTDPSGSLLYYATVSQKTGLIAGNARGLPLRLAPVFRAIPGGNLLVSFTLAAPSDVSVEFFTPSGRLAAKAVGRSLAAGRRTLAVGYNDAFGQGAYIARISANGSPVFYGRLLVTR
jgi:hypothetical protein